MGSPDKNQELEVKFYISNLPVLEDRLKVLGARLAFARVHETNLRFDTAEGELTRNFQVLRLRQDTIARVTYKGPGQSQGGVQARQEIEFEVSDYDKAQALLEALGFGVRLMYEKFRTTYELDGVLVTLDEMPYGNFTELEGPDPESIQEVGQKLGLDWEARVQGSYTGLFERLRGVLGLKFRDLSFANFEAVRVRAEDLGVRPGDE